MSNRTRKIQWHMGFYGAIELEFREDKEYLEFQREYQLSKKALAMDMLIVRKNGNVSLHNDIGRIFRMHNIVEYKNPRDALGIDEFYKGIAYACLYKSMGEKRDAVKAEDLTLTFIRQGFPRELFKKLRALGYDITERYKGIYYIDNCRLMPIQIVITKDVAPEEHLALKVLSDKVKKEHAKKFIEDIASYTQKGDKENADAVLNIAAEANENIFDAKKEGLEMFDKIYELNKEKLDDKYKEIYKEIIEQKVEQGIDQGIEQGRLQSIRELMKNLKFSAEQALDALGIPKSEHQKYIQML